MSDLKKLISELLSLDVADQKSCYDILRQSVELNQEWLDIANSSEDQFDQIAKMGSLTKTILGKNVIGVLVNSTNGLLIVDPEDYGVGVELRNKGRYGENELRNIKNYSSRESSILLIGAHIGSLVIPLAKSCHKIVAIEANPDTFKLLQLNLILNSVKNCDSFNIAANDKSEKLQFLLSRANSGGSKRKPKIDDYMYSYDNPVETTVDAVALDDFLGEQIFDIIIMDIEGSEYFALKGMPQILAKTEALVMEFVPHHLRKVSGTDIKDLIDLLGIFHRVIVPSKGITIMNDDFEYALEYMYENDISEDAMIFLKYSV